MHAERTDTGTCAQRTGACRSSVAMVKLGAVRFMGKGSGGDSAWRQRQTGTGTVTGTGTDAGTGTGAGTGAGTGTGSSTGTGIGTSTRTRTGTGEGRREQAGSSRNAARWQKQQRLTGTDTGTGTCTGTGTGTGTGQRRSMSTAFNSPHASSSPTLAQLMQRVNDVHTTTQKRAEAMHDKFIRKNEKMHRTRTFTTGQQAWLHRVHSGMTKPAANGQNESFFWPFHPDACDVVSHTSKQHAKMRNRSTGISQTVHTRRPKESGPAKCWAWAAAGEKAVAKRSWTSQLAAMPMPLTANKMACLTIMPGVFSAVLLSISPSSSTIARNAYTTMLRSI